ncbi:DUF4258 domain-containing protein [Chitinophaga sp. sic0106]|uniref:DUF4258 domain-containing protein n=1 Tax=Chitinophaga sp. sic0106 TaxID=2854785 RepID=UPI001C47428F|nr:DUF4258 domain-containing protein [Chitinophaga sp. sic0106]MBV7531136.1 DUF4258 domain-containing protein [Chitinophaga sp. sic0106]
MKSVQKYLPVLLLGVLLIAGWHQEWWKRESGTIPGSKGHVTSPPTPEPKIAGALLNREARLEFTKHAKCRMECRHVTAAEVAEILQKGEVNLEKSNPNDRPCPTFALEGYSHDGQHLRIVFAPCDKSSARVVTCIDLDKDWTCHCE